MGLDMYLDARRSVSKWDDSKEFHAKLNELAQSFGYDMEVHSIEFRAMYWRKANAIHKWFVTNVQNGVDDCGTYDVSTEQLNELLIMVNNILEDHSKAESILPPQAGFFFGSLEINNYYFEDLKMTKEGIEKLLNTIGNGAGWDWHITYHSSW